MLAERPNLINGGIQYFNLDKNKDKQNDQKQDEKKDQQQPPKSEKKDNQMSKAVSYTHLTCTGRGKCYGCTKAYESTLI